MNYLKKKKFTRIEFFVSIIFLLVFIQLFQFFNMYVGPGKDFHKAFEAMWNDTATQEQVDLVNEYFDNIITYEFFDGRATITNSVYSEIIRYGGVNGFLFTMVVNVLVFVSFIIVVIRRFRDLGKTGYYVFFLIIPIYNIYPFIQLFFYRSVIPEHVLFENNTK